MLRGKQSSKNNLNSVALYLRRNLTLAWSKCQNITITTEPFWYIPCVSTFQLRSSDILGKIYRGPQCFSAILCWVNKSTSPTALELSWLCWDIQPYTIYWTSYVAMSVLRENEWKILSIGTTSTQRSPLSSAHSFNSPLTVVNSQYKPKSPNYDTKNSQ